MAFATSAIVGGQALAVAVTGRLAESYGPAAAFAVGSTAAALTCAIALTARPAPYPRQPRGAGRTTEGHATERAAPENALHARVPPGTDHVPGQADSLTGRAPSSGP
jgi:hypothetical protein